MINARCLDDRKRRFPSWADAQRAIDSIARGSDDLEGLQPYWCVTHACYHVGHDRVGLQRSRWGTIAPRERKELRR